MTTGKLLLLYLTGLALVIFVCRVAYGDDSIPFTTDGYFINIPVHLESKGIAVDTVCTLDTAATKFWVGTGLQKKLRLTSVLPEFKWPPVYVDVIRVGNKEVYNQLGYVWSTLSPYSCLVGLDLLAETYTTFNFKLNRITTTDKDDYWHTHWEACRQGLCNFYNWLYGYCPWEVR